VTNPKRKTLHGHDALERAATSSDLEDAEDTAAVLERKARDAAGQTRFVPAGEARRRLGLPA